MPEVHGISEQKHILPYLEARGLVRQYRKAKQFLLDGDTLRVCFKERNPKHSGAWYFRINKQFRAVGFFRDTGRLVIYDIDNHQ